MTRYVGPELRGLLQRPLQTGRPRLDMGRATLWRCPSNGRRMRLDPPSHVTDDRQIPGPLSRTNRKHGTSWCTGRSRPTSRSMTWAANLRAGFYGLAGRSPVLGDRSFASGRVASRDRALAHCVLAYTPVGADHGHPGPEPSPRSHAILAGGRIRSASAAETKACTPS